MLYRVGIVGCGQIASTFEDDPSREHPYTHAGAYEKAAQTEIVAAADINEERLYAFSERWGVKPTYQDYNEMLKRERLDIISVTTNTPMHCEITTRAAKSGVKAIFCEKPIATNLKDADKMIEACREQGVKLIINHTRRWSPIFRRAKKMVDSGLIRGLCSITGYFTSGLLIMGTHLFDMFRFFAGDVDQLVGQIERINGATDPSGSGFFRFKNGVLGSVMGSSQKRYAIFELDLQGPSGRILIKNNGKTLELWTPEKGREHIDYNRPNELVLEELSSAREMKNSMVAAIEDIVTAIEQDREGQCTGWDGRAALELALAFHKSDQEGREVLLPLKDKSLTVISR